MRAFIRTLSAAFAISAAFAVGPLSAQSASLSGSVVTDPAEQPIANAEIVFTKLNLSGRSDAKGNFSITGVPTGKQEVTVRRIGYEPVVTIVNFGASQKVEVDFMLKAIATKLDKVNVNANASERYAIRLRDFEDRRALGTGKFLTADYFANADGRTMSNLISAKITGLGTTGSGSKQILIAQRGQSFNCAVQVLVNGLPRYTGNGMQETFDVNSINATEVIGFEYYTPMTTPAQYMGTGTGGGTGSGCGTVLIWTK